uniref:Aminomethyltransferase folate-binding domain-containing protein n=1 Tax=Setaria digitata TaxID=48799 RepID=A0A915Q502_9BILA
MTTGRVYSLVHRGLLRLRGKEVLQFLQVLVTNDVRRLEDGRAQYALLLNSRGRIVEDLILYRQKDVILIESDRKNQSSLRKLLEMYKVHKDVTIDEETKKSVYHVDDAAIDIPGIQDPRVPSFGKRILSGTSPSHQIMDEDAYQERRFDFGIPEGPNELAGELPLFMNADIMNGVSASKGCYLGQELTARSLTAPEIRKRVLPFTCTAMITGSLVNNEGRLVGKVVACNGRKGLAMVPISRNSSPMHFRSKTENIETFLPSWWPTDPLHVSPLTS